jgi:hypothetical protein
LSGAAGGGLPCLGKVRDAERRCPHRRGILVHVWSTAIGTERFATVSSGASLRRSQLPSCGNKPPCRTLIRMSSSRCRSDP